MTEDAEIWRAAHLLMKRHGANAATVAAQRAAELVKQCDPDGQMIWQRIGAAVCELARTTPDPGEWRN